MKEALRRMGELGNKEAELREANQKLAELGAKVESFELDPFQNMDFVGEFAYYMAYTDAIRAGWKGWTGGRPLGRSLQVLCGRTFASLGILGVDPRHCR
ncbi:hypothetical protein OROHE_007868 [Orobanche hederae]